jgi:8-oxo-dGTP diphosphatase
MSSAGRPKDMPRKRGAVGIVIEENGFLVIRRSPFVRAPNLVCFPGGTIEAGESSEAAVIREMHEELGLVVDVRERLWKSVTSWGTELEWFLLDCSDATEPQPDPREVAEVFWAKPQQLLVRGDLLGSVFDFFRAIRSGEIQLGKIDDGAHWNHLLKG